MPNKVKQSDWVGFASKGGAAADPGRAAGSARVQAAGAFLGLLVMALLLPSPGSWSALLSGSPAATAHASVSATAEQAILVTASLLVWAILGWSLAVACAAWVGRLPGVPGRCGRALLGRIAPAAAGRLIAAAVGVSLLAGTSACAVPAMAAGGAPSTSGSATGASAGQEPSTSATATPPVDPTGGAALPSISIDWPGPQPTGVVPDAAAAAPDAGGDPTGQSGQDPVGAEDPLPTEDPVPPDSVPTEDAAHSDAAPAQDGVPSQDAARVQDTAAPPITSIGTETAAGVRDAQPVTVRSGDSLWSIAHSRLPVDATNSDIDTAWRAWYSANTSVIGDNPDLIQPGQLLLPPDNGSGY